VEGDDVVPDLLARRRLPAGEIPHDLRVAVEVDQVVHIRFGEPPQGQALGIQDTVHVPIIWPPGHDAGVVALSGGLRAPFPRYWLSGFLANFGDGVRLAAFPLLAVHFTRSPTAVAAVTAVQGLPWLVLGAGAGVLVDRTDRRRVMVTMSLVQAAVIAALAATILAHSAGLLLIYLAAVVTGIASGLRGTAASVSVPQLVSPADLDRANGRLIAGQIVGNELAGPAAGGWLFGLAAVLPFAVNVGMLGIAVLLLLTLPSVFRPAPRPSRDVPVSRAASLRQDLAEGVRWLRHSSRASTACCWPSPRSAGSRPAPRAPG
jgi:MFS family permease